LVRITACRTSGENLIRYEHIRERDLKKPNKGGGRRDWQQERKAAG